MEPLVHGVVMSLSPAFATYVLCDFGQVTQLLSLSFCICTLELIVELGSYSHEN